MNSPPDDKSCSDSEQEYSDGEGNGSPEIWEAPPTSSQTMMKRMQQFNQSKEPVKCDSPNITADFISTFSRVSKFETTPPPEKESPETTPSPAREHPETTPPPARESPETTPPPKGERPDKCMLSVKDKAKMFEKTSQEQKPNPFAALILPPKDYEEAVKTDEDTNQVDPSIDKSTLERKVEGQGNKEKQPLQGHHLGEEPIEEHIPEQLNEGHSELDRTSPWPQRQRPRKEEYPGPRSSHGW